MMPDSTKLLLGSKVANWTSTRGDTAVGKVRLLPTYLPREAGCVARLVVCSAEPVLTACRSLTLPLRVYCCRRPPWRARTPSASPLLALTW